MKKKMKNQKPKHAGGRPATVHGDARVALRLPASLAEKMELRRRQLGLESLSAAIRDALERSGSGSG